MPLTYVFFTECHYKKQAGRGISLDIAANNLALTVFTFSFDTAGIK